MNFAYVWGLIGDYMIAAALGAVISSGEIVARYRDEPWDTLRSLPAIFYMLINALASMGALTIVRTFGMTFGASQTNTPLIQVLVAGLGAMMIFRSAFFTMRVNNQDVAVGAASFLQVMLDAVDREVDRRRATLRAERVRRIMEQVAFDKALTALPTYCIALMQNLDDDDQKKLLNDLKVLSSSTELDAPVKAQILGLAVMNYLGEEVLQASVDALKMQIQNPLVPGQAPAELPTTPAGALEKILGRMRRESPAENLPASATPAEATPVAITATTAPAIETQAAPVIQAEKPVDINRVLSRVREKSSTQEAPPATVETQPAIDNDPPASLLADTPAAA